jgi:hypothetical protein
MRSLSLLLPMKRPLTALALSSLICALPAAPAFAQTTVQSLDGVRGAIQTRDARKMFDTSMSGIQPADRFGTPLPAGFTDDYLVQQLAPGEDAKRLVLSSAKAWPARPNSYVAMICLASTPDEAARSKQYYRGECQHSDPTDTQSTQVWFGVFETNGNGAPKLVARTDGPVDTETDWSSTNIDSPGELGARDAKDGLLILPESWKRFDLAPYQIKSGEYAFGVRAGWSEGYAGGGADFEALYLFRVEGESLRVVFAQPMSFDKMIAGDWHKDGTRSHDVTDASNTLVLLPGQIDGYHDIQLREQGGKWRRTFKWSPSRHIYE